MKTIGISVRLTGAKITKQIKAKIVVKLVKIVLLKFKKIELLIIRGKLILTSSLEVRVLNLSNKTIVSFIL